MANLAKEIAQECIADLKERFPEESEGTIIQLSKLEPMALGIQYVSSLGESIDDSSIQYLINELEFEPWDCAGTPKYSFENCGIRCTLFVKNGNPMVEIIPPKGKPQLHLYSLLLKWAGRSEEVEGTTEEDLKVAVNALS